MQSQALTINGAYIRALRDAHGYTLRTFAVAVGTSESTLSRVEGGKRQPMPDLRKRIAAKLQVPLIVLSDPVAFDAALRSVLHAAA